MGGTTTKYGFPYPTGTDRVADGDNAMQALAEAVDTQQAPVAGVVTGTANVTATASAVYRTGGLVVVNVAASTSTFGVVIGAQILSLPVGFRPVVEWRGTIVSYPGGGGSTAKMVWITTAGLVMTGDALPASVAIYGTLMFPAA